MENTNIEQKLVMLSSLAIGDTFIDVEFGTVTEMVIDITAVKLAFYGADEDYKYASVNKYGCPFFYKNDKPVLPVNCKVMEKEE